MSAHVPARSQIFSVGAEGNRAYVVDVAAFVVLHARDGVRTAGAHVIDFYLLLPRAGHASHRSRYVLAVRAEGACARVLNGERLPRVRRLPRLPESHSVLRLGCQIFPVRTDDDAM